LISFGCRTTKAKKLTKKAPIVQLKPADTLSYSSKIGRFEDTTNINLIAGKSPNIGQYNNAISNWNKKKYNDACPKFVELAKSLTNGDSLQFESLFYCSECALVSQDLGKAEIYLNKLLKNSAIGSNLTERVLVRLGHVNCAKDNLKEAGKYFSRLKKEYPKSDYLPLANCNSVEK
jgi:TolA-binding protein